jgi:hypothetical protein
MFLSSTLRELCEHHQSDPIIIHNIATLQREGALGMCLLLLLDFELSRHWAMAQAAAKLGNSDQIIQLPEVALQFTAWHSGSHANHKHTRQSLWYGENDAPLPRVPQRCSH